MDKITKTHDPHDQVDPVDIGIDSTLINFMPKSDTQSTVILETTIENKQPHKLPPFLEEKSNEKDEINITHQPKADDDQSQGVVTIIGSDQKDPRIIKHSVGVSGLVNLEIGPEKPIIKARYRRQKVAQQLQQFLNDAVITGQRVKTTSDNENNNEINVLPDNENKN